MKDRPNPDFKLRLEFVGDNPENQSGKSRKFWQAEVYGTHFVRRWGRIDTQGQTMAEVFPTPDAARRAATKMAEEKRRKGYKLEVDIITLIGQLADGL